MKKMMILIILCSLSMSIWGYQLRSNTAYGELSTQDSSRVWDDVVSVEIDVTNADDVMVFASINMRPIGDNTQAREANYNIYRSDLATDSTGVIKRQIKFNTESGVMSWGIGTLVHIFDVSSLSGNKTYTIEHSNQGGTSYNRNVWSEIQLTAVTLSTLQSPYYDLGNDVKRIGGDATTINSSTHTAVPGLVSDALSLPGTGDIFVVASINNETQTEGETVAEYKLQYRTSFSGSWTDLGNPVQRTVVNRWDNGIISLTGLLQDQPQGNEYQFQVTHARISGEEVTTENSNLVVIALSHTGGRFPAFYSSLGAGGVTIREDATSAAEVTSTTITSTTNNPNLFVSTQYLLNASNLEDLERLRAQNQIFLGTTAGDSYFRYMPDNDNQGAGGFVGLFENLTDNTEYTISMKHDIDAVVGGTINGDESLTTKNVILCGFQTNDDEESPVPVNLSSFYANYIGGVPTIYWTTQTEENNAYWNVYRGTTDSFETAYQINAEPVPGNGTTNYASDYVFTDLVPVIQNTTYWYWIEDVATDGETVIHEPITLEIPFEDEPVELDIYGLEQNYPNPFNPSTSISFSLEEYSEVELTIYNMNGQKVKDLEVVRTGLNGTALWDGTNESQIPVSSGVYFYKLTTDNKVYQKKMLMVK